MEALLLPILLIAVFYFLLIRPQQRQRRQMQDMQQTLVVGSKVMTGAGLLGTVAAIDDDEVVLEVAPGVTNRYVRRAIVNVLESPNTEETLDTSALDSPEFTETELTDADTEKNSADADELDTAKDSPADADAKDESRDRANDGETR